jgi:hypothetical protein
MLGEIEKTPSSVLGKRIADPILRTAVIGLYTLPVDTQLCGSSSARALAFCVGRHRGKRSSTFAQQRLAASIETSHLIGSHASPVLSTDP